MQVFGAGFYQNFYQSDFSNGNFSNQSSGRVGSLQQNAQDLTKRIEEQKIQMIIAKLKLREKQVIAHEMAHKAVGGRYAGAVHYVYTRGPDGKYYITGGDVSIDVSEEPDPEATIRKMEIVRAAALAPVDPSPQDIRVAQMATMKEMKARLELQKQRTEEMKQTEENIQKKGVYLNTIV